MVIVDIDKASLGHRMHVSDYMISIPRDVRQQPEQFSQALNSLTSSQTFSQYGQCGKRNAHGVNGRINNPAQRYEEGDTGVGEYPWQVRDK